MKKLLPALLLFLVFLVLLNLLIQRFETPQPIVETVIKVKEAYLCKYVRGNYIQVDQFQKDDFVTVCIKITSTNTSEKDMFLTAYVYKENSSRLINNVTDRISIDDEIFEITYFFDPGTYDIKLYYTRQLLFESTFEIIE